jgi:hypothetical protein
MKKTLLILFSLLVPVAPSIAAADGFVVVVAKNSPQTHITKAQLRRLLTGEGFSWPDGSKAAVLLGPAGDPARIAALKQVCGMSEGEFGKFVLQLSFNGEGKSAPKTMPTAVGVRQFALVTPGAIGIVSAGDANDSVKVIPVD